MQPTHNDDTGNSPSLPTEIWMQIICKRESGLSLADLTRLCRVNKNFRQMAMEAILESDVLDYVGYWDPIRRTTARYGPEVMKRSFVYTPGHHDTDTNNASDTLSHGKTLHPPSETKQLTPNEDFWITHLKTRTMGKIRNKPPTRDHVLLRKVAEYVWQWKLDNNHVQGTPIETKFEDMVRTVCEVAVKYAYIHDRRTFFIGPEMRGCRVKCPVIDESCAVFRDALMNVAVFLDDTDLLESTIWRNYTVLCPYYRSFANGTSDKNNKDQAPFKRRIPCADKALRCWAASFRLPVCGNSLNRLGNPAKVAVETGNMQCASILLKSLAEYHSELNLCREDIITTASVPEQIEFLRLAIDAGPPLTAYNVPMSSFSSRLHMFGRSSLDTRSQAGVALSKILETTTDVEVFDLVYDAILAGYNEEEGLWWTKPLKTFPCAAHTLSSWGTKRLQRAVRDDCTSVVERLFQLGYNLDPNYSLAEANDENRNLVKYLIDSETTRDTALPTAVRNGNVQMVELLFKEGAGRNHRNVRKAIYAAISIGCNGDTEMLRVLTSQPCLEGLFNQETRRCFKRDFDVEGRRNVWRLLELL
jgi:hypothetical protein